MKWKRCLPGYIATGLVIVTTTLWTFWGIAEGQFHLYFPACGS